MPVSRRGLLKLLPVAGIGTLSGIGTVTDGQKIPLPDATDNGCGHEFWTWEGDAADPATEFTCRDCGRVVHRSQLRGWI